MDHLFSTNNSSLKQTPLTCNGHTRPIVHLHFSRIVNNRFYLISASKDGSPMIRKGETGDWIGTFQGHKGAVWGVVLNGDATRAATGSADFTAKLWNAQTGDEMHTFAHKHIVRAVDFSPDEKSLLTSSNDRNIQIFDLTNHSTAPQVFTGHNGTIRDVYYTQDDGNCFVSACEDKTVRFWDRRTGSTTTELKFNEVPYSVEVTGDKSIVSISHGSTVSFYKLDTMNKIAEFTIPSTQIYSVSMNPAKDTFVCGGEDFVIYKFDFISQKQIESFQGHFGAVHCVRYSPDGELYASGSEDGTLRLWQNTVGKNYGLWQYIDHNKSEQNGD